MKIISCKCVLCSQQLAQKVAHYLHKSPPRPRRSHDLTSCSGLWMEDEAMLALERMVQSILKMQVRVQRDYLCTWIYSHVGNFLNLGSACARSCDGFRYTGTDACSDVLYVTPTSLSSVRLRNVFLVQVIINLLGNTPLKPTILCSVKFKTFDTFLYNSTPQKVSHATAFLK